MTYNQLMNEIRKTYNNYFPKSKVDVWYSDNLYSCIHITCYLSESNKECANNIIQNDMFSIMFKIDTINGELERCLNLDKEININLCLNNQYKHYTINPINEMYYSSSQNVGFRQTKGNGEKIIKSFDRFCKRLQDSIKNNYVRGNIHYNFIDIVKEKLSL